MCCCVLLQTHIQNLKSPNHAANPHHITQCFYPLTAHCTLKVLQAMPSSPWGLRLHPLGLQWAESGVWTPPHPLHGLAGVLRSGLYPLVKSLQGTIMLCTFRRVCGGQGVVFSPAGSLQCCSMSVQNHTALKSASATTNIIPEHWKNSNSDFIKLH